MIDSNDNQYIPPSTDSDDRHDHRPRNELLTRGPRWTRNLAVVIVVWYSVAGALPPAFTILNRDSSLARGGVGNLVHVDSPPLADRDQRVRHRSLGCRSKVYPRAEADRHSELDGRANRVPGKLWNYLKFMNNSENLRPPPTLSEFD